MGDLGDPLAASLGKTSSSYVGKMCASHGNPVAPSAHKSALSLHTQDTFKTQTPARTHPQVPRLALQNSTVLQTHAALVSPTPYQEG